MADTSNSSSNQLDNTGDASKMSEELDAFSKALEAKKETIKYEGDECYPCYCESKTLDWVLTLYKGWKLKK